MRIRLGCGLLAASLLISTSVLSDEMDASYYCTEKLSAGLVFNLQTKQWQDAHFNADTAFVLHLHYLGDKDVNYGTMHFQQQRYSVTITPQGSNEGQKCSSSDRGTCTLIQ